MCPPNSRDWGHGCGELGYVSPDLLNLEMGIASPIGDTVVVSWGMCPQISETPRPTAASIPGHNGATRQPFGLDPVLHRATGAPPIVVSVLFSPKRSASSFTIRTFFSVTSCRP